MFEILIIFFCVALNAFLAGVETGFVSVSKPRLRQLAAKGNKSAKKILEFRESPERTLSVIQVGITLVGAFAAAVGGAGATESVTPYFQSEFGFSENVAESISLIMVVLPITYLSVVFGELIPKTLALRNPILVSTKSAAWLSLAERVLSPVVNVLEWSTKIIINTFFNQAAGKAPSNEFVLEIDRLETHHRQAVINFAHLEGRLVRELFVPWKEATFLNAGLSAEEVAPIVFASGHTRLPVLEDGKVVGVLHTKEFLAYRENKGKDWESIVRPAIKVFGGEKALSALRLMQKKRGHMAIVFDKSGRSLGIITLEDIIEEFLGDIYDEDDESIIRKVFSDRVKRKIKPM